MQALSNHLDGEGQRGSRGEKELEQRREGKLQCGCEINKNLINKTEKNTRKIDVFLDA